MVTDNPVTPAVISEAPVETIEVRPSPPRRISWGAIIAGVVVALVTQIVLGILGIAIGVSTIDPVGTRAEWPQGLSIGAGIWWVITGLLSLFAGGIVAGRLAGIPRKSDGALHGLITYGVTTLLSIYLLTTAVGGLVSGAWSVMQGGMSGAVETARGIRMPSEMAIPSIAPPRGSNAGRLRADVQSVLRASPREAAAPGGDVAAEQEIYGAARRFLEREDAASREGLVNALVNRTAMNREGAERTVDEWQRKHAAPSGQAVIPGTSMREQDIEALAERTKRVVVSAAIWSFIALVIGAAAAALGGMVGSTAKSLRTGLFAEATR